MMGSLWRLSVTKAEVIGSPVLREEPMRGVVCREGVWQGGCDGRSVNNVWEAGALDD